MKNKRINLGDTVKFPGSLEGTYLIGKVIYKDTAKVGGKSKTLLEIKPENKLSRLAYADKCIKQ